MHIDERNEVVLAAQQWRRRKTRCVSGEGERLDVLVARGSSLLLVLWWPHVFIGKIRLELHRPITD
jgi:hypothetical protein